MKIDIKNEDGITIFKVDGDIDCFTVPELNKSIRQELKREEHSLVVDLSDVTYLDSSAIGLFVKVHRGLETGGCSLSLLNANRETLQLLKLTYVDNILNIFSSEDEMKESLKKEKN